MNGHPRQRTLVLLLGLALGSSCQSDAERARLGQVARLAEHIDRLRRADNADKRVPLDALVAADCHDDTSCALKDLCVRAYQLHQRSLDSINALKRVAAEETAAVARARPELAATERDLVQAKELMDQCAEEQVRVVRKSLM